MLFDIKLQKKYYLLSHSSHVVRMLFVCCSHIVRILFAYNRSTHVQPMTNLPSTHSTMPAIMNVYRYYCIFVYSSLLSDLFTASYSNI